MPWVRNLKLRVSLVTSNELCGCQLILRTSKLAGAPTACHNYIIPKNSSKRILPKQILQKNPKNFQRISQKFLILKISNSLHRAWRLNTLSGLFEYSFTAGRWEKVFKKRCSWKIFGPSYIVAALTIHGIQVSITSNYP